MENINDLISTEQINEVNLIDFIKTYNDLVKLKILSEESFNSMLTNLGVQITDDNTYSFNGEFEYRFE
jgi:hypothetical protein